MKKKKKITQYLYTIIFVLFLITAISLAPRIYRVVTSRLLYAMIVIAIGVLYSFLMSKSIKEIKDLKNDNITLFL